MDIYKATKQQGNYILLATNTEVNVSVYTQTVRQYGTKVTYSCENYNVFGYKSSASCLKVNRNTVLVCTKSSKRILA